MTGEAVPRWHQVENKSAGLCKYVMVIELFCADIADCALVAQPVNVTRTLQEMYGYSMGIGVIQGQKAWPGWHE